LVLEELLRFSRVLLDYWNFEILICGILRGFVGSLRIGLFGAGFREVVQWSQFYGGLLH